jgi:hypothetical protein
LPHLTISDVDFLDPRDEALLSCWLDAPVAGTSTELFAINFDGWAVGRHAPVAELELSGSGVSSMRLPVGFPRPDLAERHPDVPWASRQSGFRIGASVLGIPTEFELLLSIVMRDGRKIPMATVRGRRGMLELPVDEHEIQPVVVTSIGRSGSSWTIELLGAHPEVLIYPPWRGEVKAASYWAEVFRVLAVPASYLQPVTSALQGQRWWLGEGRPFDDRPPDEETERFLGATQVPEVGRFCKGRIDAFCRHVATMQGKEGCRYYAEKSPPLRPSYARLLRELYPGMREILLVRDFRDVLCSVRAFNERLGQQFFGREQVATDEDYVRGFLASRAQMLVEIWNEISGVAYLLRYEDLVVEPEDTLRSLLSYLDLDRGDEVLQSMLAVPSDHERSYTHGTSASATDSIGRWRKELEPSLRDACEEAFGQALETFGYAR